MGTILILSVLIAIALASLRYGADSRDLGTAQV
jgi:hypothetical protein